MHTEDFDKAQGHWILARMGKKVLRPGGKELTLKMIDGLHVSSQDAVVEFAPGIGFTSEIVLQKKPKSYVGIDADENAVANLKKKIQGQQVKFLLGNAALSGLSENSQDKVFGEAMLTMHADHRKSEIIQEAHRILKKGGLYAIHELGLTPDRISPEIKEKIQKDLAKAIKVNARPLTTPEWISLLEKEGFEIKEVFHNPMHLLHPARIISDEGWWRAMKIIFNIFTHPRARHRIMAMRSVFTKYQKHMNAIAIIAEKV